MLRRAQLKVAIRSEPPRCSPPHTEELNAPLLFAVALALLAWDCADDPNRQVSTSDTPCSMVSPWLIEVTNSRQSAPFRSRLGHRRSYVSVTSPFTRLSMIHENRLLKMK